MDDGGRRCALPGCDRTITTTARRPERRYCTAAHRAAARRARRAAVQPEQPDGPDALADALPWLRGAIGTDAARAGHSDGPAADPVRPGLPAEATPAPDVSSGSRDRRPMPRRRHALALLGVAGILAGGYAVTDAAPEPTPVQTVPEEVAAPDGAAADTWAQRATVALASVNRQLDTLAQTEDEWRRLPENGRAVVPAPVAALEERRSVLQRRRATLQAQLDDYRSLRRAQQELANSEQHLRAVETALADAPPRRRRSAEQEAAIAALEEQRDLRIRRRDVQRTELATLQDGVSTATRTPLPDDGAATATITDDVMEMVHKGGTEPARPDPEPSRPEVVAGRESDDGKPRQEVGTSGPPDPRGPRDESDERRAAKEKRAAAQSHEQQKDREPPDKDEAESRAHYRQTEMRGPAERQSANTKSANKDTTARASAHRGSTDRDAKDRDTRGSKGGDKERDATEHRAKKHDSRQHDEVKKRKSTNRESDGSESDGSESGGSESDDRKSTGRAKHRDSQDHNSQDHHSRHHGAEQRDSQGRKSHHRDSEDRDSEKRDSKRHRSTEHGSMKHDPDRADESGDRDGGPHRGATSADR